MNVPLYAPFLAALAGFLFGVVVGYALKSRER